MKKVRNIDIAARVGVSPAAVSIALSGKKGISDETRMEILRVAREMGGALKENENNGQAADFIALLIANYSTFVPPFIITELIRFAETQKKPFRLISGDQVLQDFPSGIIHCRILFIFGPIKKEILDKASSVVPFIITNSDQFSNEYFCVRPDYSDAAYIMMRHLSKLGHRNYLYVNTEYPSEVNQLILQGFQKQILQMRFPLLPEQIIDDVSADGSIRQNIVSEIRKLNISAIFCTTETAAVHISRLLLASGFRIPEDITIAVMSMPAPQQHPVYEFTHIAFDLKSWIPLLQEMLSAETKAKRVLLPASSVVPGNTEAASKYDPTTKKIALALIFKDHPTYRIVRAGFLNTIQQFGYQAEVVGIADDNDYDYHQICHELLKEKVDGVVMWMPYPDIIRKFAENGIPVVCPHTVCKDGGTYGLSANIAALPEQVGQSVAEYFIRNLKSHHGVIAISKTADNELESSISREFRRVIQERCPHIVVFDELRLTEHNEQSVSVIRDYINRTPNLLGAFTTAGATCVSWAAAKRELGHDDMTIVGTDYTEETLNLVADGDVQAFVAQPLYEEAQGSVIALDTIFRGNSHPFFTSLDAPLVTRDNLEPYRKLLKDVNNWYA